MNKKIVCYVTDSGFVPYTVVSAVSLLRHNSDVTVCVFNTGLTSEDRQLLFNAVNSNGGVLLFFDVSSVLQDLSKKYKGYSLYKGQSSYLPYVKLFIADFLSGNSSRVLYLDSDTLVNGSLDYLFDGFFMFGRPIALASDCIPFSYRKFVNVPLDRPYYNCGVMLLDLARYRSSGFKRRFFEWLSISDGMPLAEQDLINRFMSSDVFLLPAHFNSLPHYQMFDYSGLLRFVRCIPYSLSDVKMAFRFPVVIHFAGNTLARPWFKSSRHPFRPLYTYTARVAGVPPKFVNRLGGFFFVYRLQWFLWRVLPRSLFNVVASVMYRIHIFIRYRV